MVSERHENLFSKLVIRLNGSKLQAMNIKPIAFRLGAILLPVALLVTLEGVLRIAGVGHDARTPFQEIPGKTDYLAFSPDFAKKYFNGFEPAVAFDPIRAQKSDSVFRVFVLGGSSTAGFPYHFYYGFPARLQARLESISLKQQVEVVNLGLTAVNSFTVWDLRNAVVKLRPDAVVIYAGHNEYYGAFGAGSTIYQLGNRVWMKRLLIRLKGTALFSLLEQAISPKSGKSDPNATLDRTLMARVIGDRTIKLDDAVFRAGIDQFERNMSAVLETIAAKGIPVFIGTVVSNLADQPPLGEDSAAREEFERGRSLLEQGETAAAREAYLAAKELDDIRFRAPEQINQVIKSFGGRENVFVVDIGQTFLRVSSSGVENNSLFVDHLHPNHTGYDLIAEQFYQAMAANPSLASLNRSRTMDRYAIDPFEHAAATAQLVRLKSAYPFVKGKTAEQEAAAYKAALDRFYYEGTYVDSLAVLAVAELKAPYEGLREAIGRAKSDGDTLSALLMYRSLLYWQPFNSTLMKEAVSYAAENTGYLDEVANIARFSMNRTSDLYHANVLAAIRIRQGHFDDADVLLSDIEKRNPSSKPMLFNRARLLVLRGDTTEARKYYGRYTGDIPSPAAAQAPRGTARLLIQSATDALNRKQFLRGLALADSAEASRPDLPDAVFVRGRLLFEMDRLDEAAAAFEQVIALDADYPGAWHNLGNAHFQNKKYRDAVSAYLHEARERPEARAWHAVGGAYWQLGLSDSSRTAYEQAVALDRAYAPVYSSLAEWYEASGDHPEALRYAQMAAEIDSDNLDYRYRVGVLLSRTGRQDLAVDILEDVAKARPWDFGALFNLGQSLQRLGRQEEARTVLARAEAAQKQQLEVNRLGVTAQDFAGNFEARVAYADALRQSGRVRESIDEYLIAEALRPKNLALRSNIATTFLQIGDTTEALARYRSILAEDSTVVETWLNLYVYYTQTGRRKQAQESLERAMIINPDHPMIRQLRDAS